MAEACAADRHGPGPFGRRRIAAEHVPNRTRKHRLRRCGALKYDESGCRRE
jgi:hypothetical protein